MIEQFHFLRPGWLLLLLPLAAWLWGLFRGRYDHGNWRAVVDERLMPYVLSGSGGARGHGVRALPGAAAGLAIIALAGPTWEKLPQPVYQTETALVIMLDLRLATWVAMGVPISFMGAFLFFEFFRESSPRSRRSTLPSCR